MLVVSLFPPNSISPPSHAYIGTFAHPSCSLAKAWRSAPQSDLCIDLSPYIAYCLSESKSLPPRMLINSDLRNAAHVASYALGQLKYPLALHAHFRAYSCDVSLDYLRDALDVYLADTEKVVPYY